MLQKLALAVGLFFCISNPIQAQPPSEASIRQLLETTKAAEMSAQMFDQMLPQLQMMAPNVPAQFWNDLREEFNAESLIVLLIPVYQKHLSQADVDAINVFYQSTAGQNFINAQGPIMQDSMMIGQQWGQQIAQKVMQKSGAQ